MQALSQLSYSPTAGGPARYAAPLWLSRRLAAGLRFHPRCAPFRGAGSCKGEAMNRTADLVRNLAIAALGLFASIALAADASGISGTWAASFDSQVGVQTYTYTFK